MHFMSHEPIYQQYIDLKEVLKDKGYDIVTTNQDTLFSREFTEKDVAIIQGDWRYLQCSKLCHEKVYLSNDLCDELFERIQNGKLPKEFIPHCTKCGAEIHE